MKKKVSDTGLRILFCLTFISPVTFSVLYYEMDVIQRMFFCSTSLLLLLVLLRNIYINKNITERNINLNKSLLVIIIIFPLTFLTAFLNGSSDLLILKLSEIIIPLTIILQAGLIFSILGEEKFFKVVSATVVTVSTIFSTIGVLEVFQIKIIQLPSIIPPGSTLGHRSFAAEFLLPSLPFLFLLNEFISKDKKVYLLIAAVINVSFLLFTRNRSGLIILIVAAVLYLVFILMNKQKKDKLKISLTFIGVLIISFLISLLPVKGTERPDFQSTASSLVDTEFKSNVLRLSFWDASVQMIKENPFTGVGLYKWSGYYPKYNREYFNDDNVTHIHSIHAHNDFLELFVENGILSSIVFLLIYVSIIIILLKRSRSNEKYFYLLLTFLITSAYSLVAFPNHKFASYFLACVVAGVALINLDNDERKLLKFKLVNLSWLLLLFVLIGGSTSYIKLISELNYGEAIYLKQRAQFPLMYERLQRISEIFYPFDTSKQPINYYRGIANSYLGNYPAALENNLSGQQLAPYNPILMRNIASSYFGMKKYNEAIGDLNKCIALGKTTAEVYYLCGVNYISMNQYNKGCEDLEKAKVLGHIEAANLLKMYCNN